MNKKFSFILVFLLLVSSFFVLAACSDGGGGSGKAISEEDIVGDWIGESKLIRDGKSGEPTKIGQGTITPNESNMITLVFLSEGKGFYSEGAGADKKFVSTVNYKKGKFEARPRKYSVLDVDFETTFKGEAVMEDGEVVLKGIIEDRGSDGKGGKYFEKHEWTGYKKK